MWRHIGTSNVKPINIAAGDLEGHVTGIMYSSPATYVSRYVAIYLISYIAAPPAGPEGLQATFKRARSPCYESLGETDCHVLVTCGLRSRMVVSKNSKIHGTVGTGSRVLLMRADRRVLLARVRRIIVFTRFRHRVAHRRISSSVGWTQLLNRAKWSGLWFC